MDDERFPPREHHGVMVSSTFADLKQHRAALARALENQGLYAEAMEHDAAQPVGTVIDSSLRMVRRAVGYVGVISHKYGTIPDSAEHNPDGFSLTELEFREARRLGRPILIFIMGDDHDVKPADVERDPEKVAKLEAFREEVKLAEAESRLQRVYYEFNSLHEFEVAATQSVAELRLLLDSQRGPVPPHQLGNTDGIPTPPALYAEPRYIGSHAFVGRAAELETLYDWAGPAEPHPVLLFEAIGGAGKSMLTWEWTLSHASGARPDLAGTFWYSFYEKGAVMTDFCQRALAYMTGQSLEALRKKKQRELTSQLQLQLQARPWLLVLDGLERILVAYHRYDAAQVADERAGRTDEIGHRDPAAAIRPQDDDLLRGLAVATPSKILITSRLVPRALLNPAGQPVPGVRWERLAGLRPADAEALLLACGVRGDSQLIQDYLQRHCDCHPLVTGIVAGLVQDYLPDRGNFDSWTTDPGHGGHLNLAELDLVQKRNHILKAALAALPDEARQLLATLALVSEAVDYRLLAALNPHLPPRQQAPLDPEELEEGNEKYVPYTPEQEQAAAPALARTVRDLERRGLLQYDRQIDRYDLHPVVRGYVSDSLAAADRNALGERVVDYFSTQAQNPYEQAETLDDVRNGLELVRTLLQMGRIESAFDACYAGLLTALIDRLEAAAEVLSLLRSFFARDWTSPASGLDDDQFSWLATDAADAFQMLGQLEQSVAVHKAAVETDLRLENLEYLCVDLSHISEVFAEQNSLAGSERCVRLELELAELTNDEDSITFAHRRYFRLFAETGRWGDAESVWQVHLRSLPSVHHVAQVEEAYVRFLFWHGRLTEDLLAKAEQVAMSERDRPSVRALHALRGEWRLEQGEWALAAESLREAIRMTREAGLHDARLEIWLAQAQFRLGQLPAARQEAIRLSSAPDRAQWALAELWHALGDAERAAGHARAAHRWAWADGEPYIHAYQLSRATDLLNQLGAKIPVLAAYDPAQDPPLAFENQVRAVIEELRARRDGR